MNLWIWCICILHHHICLSFSNDQCLWSLSVIPFPLFISHTTKSGWSLVTMWHHTQCVMSPPLLVSASTGVLSATEVSRLRTRTSAVTIASAESGGSGHPLSSPTPVSQSTSIFSGSRVIIEQTPGRPLSSTTLVSQSASFFPGPGSHLRPPSRSRCIFSRVPDDYWEDTRQSPGPKLTDRVMGNLCINSSSNHGPWSQADLIQTSGAISDIAEIIRQLVILLSSSSSQPAEHPASWMQGRGNTCAYKKAKNIGPNRNRIAKIPHSHFRFSDRLCFNI